MIKKIEETNQKLQKANVKIKQLEETNNKYKRQENEYEGIIEDLKEKLKEM